jgi:hypothetical protein
VKEYRVQGLFDDLYFDYYNVIQFGTDKDIEDIIYATPKRPNEKIFYPLPNSNAFFVKSVIAG